MACEACEHCNGPLSPGEETEYQGHSYHSQCRKCYVCSETNLLGAEIFKGVIFCGDCSKRIFQNCLTRTAKSKPRSKSHRSDYLKRKKNKGRLLDIEDNCEQDNWSPNKTSASRPIKTSIANILLQLKNAGLKKESIDKCISTKVTEETLKKIYQNLDTGDALPSPKAESEGPDDRKEENKHKSTELSVVELGASTEMAYVALRRRSDKPVIITSGSALRRMKSKISREKHGRNTSKSGTSNETSNLNRSMHSEQNVIPWIYRPLTSILKQPYRSFKKNILDRSSLVNVLISLAENSLKRNEDKWVPREEIVDHHRHGLRRLYSTINRRGRRYELGWLHKSSQKFRRCKHYQSHNYRCMRAHVLKLAGPTRSELADIRSRLKYFITTDMRVKIAKSDK